jgi:hypothetical protein
VSWLGSGEASLKVSAFGDVCGSSCSNHVDDQSRPTPLMFSPEPAYPAGVTDILADILAIKVKVC